MEKRGQVTVFVVIGLLILIILSVVFVIVSTKNRVVESEISASTLDEVRRQVNLDVKLCFENIVEAGILDSSRHGGEAMLWDQAHIEASSTNLCNLIPTATQEIKTMYGPKIDEQCNILVKDPSNPQPPGSNPIILSNLNNINELDKYAFIFESRLPQGDSFDSTSLEVYIRDKLPNCFKLDKYVSKGWGITDENNWKYINTDSLKQYLQDHSGPDPNKKAIIVDPQPTTTGCPLDGKLIVKLNMPLKFSRERKITSEESFVLDNQEFIYNVDLTYFYKKVDDLLTRLTTTQIFDANKPISQLNTNGICKDCPGLFAKITDFKMGVENQCETKNGCHFYKATDPNYGAYLFDIKCGEYYFFDSTPKKVNNDKNWITVKPSGQNSVEVTLDGDTESIEKGSTINIGGLDVTYVMQRASGEYVLLVGKGASFLWGYYFGCGPLTGGGPACVIG